MLTRLEQAAERLAHATITCSSYEHLFEAPGDDVLIVADPPYVMETNLSPSSKLYEFGFSLGDHRRLRDCVLRCRHKVLMTYDDHPLVRELYRELFVHEASWVYSGRADRKIGRELIITNYPRQQPIL
jgi:DNA adenine methylase